MPEAYVIFLPLRVTKFTNKWLMNELTEVTLLFTKMVSCRICGLGGILTNVEIARTYHHGDTQISIGDNSHICRSAVESRS